MSRVLANTWAFLDREASAPVTFLTASMVSAFIVVLYVVVRVS